MLSIIYFFVGWVSCYCILSKFRNLNSKLPLIQSSYEKPKENLQKQEETLQNNIYNDEDLIFFVNDSPSYYDDLILSIEDEDDLDLDLSNEDDLDLDLSNEDDLDLSLDLVIDDDDEDLVLPSYDPDEYDNFDLSIDDDLNFLLNDDLDLPYFVDNDDELEFHLELDSLFVKQSAVKEEVCWWKEGF